MQADSMYSTADVIGGMMRSLRKNIRLCLVRTGAGMAIAPEGEFITHLPEFYPQRGELDGSAGLGAVRGQPISGVVEAVLLHGYYGTVIHEFAHAVENLCFRQDERDRFYRRARGADLFPGAYGMTDSDEFFAEFSESYFDQPDDIQWRWDREDDQLTRQKLSADFPEIFGFLKEIYEGWEVGSYLISDVGSPDRDILIALYEATDGPNWTNNRYWLSNKPIQLWYGVGVGDNRRVTELELSENGLSGEIPPKLGDLVAMRSLSLSRNRLSGQIPPELGNLSDLSSLYLSGNRLTGEIPPELGKLAHLEQLYIYDNQLTGEIPSELGELLAIETISLWRNQLTGEIPPELSKLENLQGLFLNGNQLTGEIPSELGELLAIETINLSDNALTGQIPIELAEIPNLYLFLAGNPLSGCIPAGLRDIPYNDLDSLNLPDC